MEIQFSQGIRVASAAVAWILLCAQPSAAAVYDKGWCTIATPDRIAPGQAIEISVTIKPDAAETLKGVRLSNHLQWSKKEGYGGFLCWQEPRDVKPGQTYTFRHTPKLDLDKMAGIMPIVFLSPDGNFEKKTKCEMLPVVPIEAPGEAPAVAGRPAAPAVSDKGWCTVQTPGSVAPGQPIEISVTVKPEAAEALKGMKLSCHLQWSRKEGYGGFLSWQEPRDVKPGQTYTFRHTPKLDLDKMAGIMPIVFLSPDGNFEKRSKFETLAVIPIESPRAASAGAGRPAAPAVSDKGWCTVQTPGSVTPGQPIEVSVTVKPDAAEVLKGMKLSCHLQWSRKEGYGGFLSWQEPREVKPGQTCTFRHNPKLDLSKMTGVMPIVFLSPDGNFEKRSKYEPLAVIPIDMNKEALAKQAEDARLAAERAAAVAPPATATRKKSALRVLPPDGPVAEGDAFTVKVEYHLDPSDNWAAGTKLTLVPLGPWVDNPDGTYTKGRSHHGYGSLGTQTVAVQPGDGVAEFKYKMGKTFRYNEIAWMASYVGGDGKNWPWSVRCAGPRIVRSVDLFDLLVDRPGGVFTYDEKPALKVQWKCGPKLAAGAPCKVDFKLFNTKGREVKAFSQSLVAGQEADVTLPECAERGVLLVEATIEGVGTRDAFYATVPDLSKTIGSARTPFGCTSVTKPENARLARKLGLTYCRQFTGWDSLEPRPGAWTFDRLDRTIEGNCAAGLVPWILVVGPPAWALPEGVFSAGYEPFPFDEKAWKEAAAVLASRYKGRIWGFEWLNEILPGTKSKDPVGDYARFCAIGTAEVKKVDPKLNVQLAGGLWPRNFRTDLLNASVAGSIDVLPVHYSTLGGVREAFSDLASVGAQSAVTVWDNETAAGLSVWDMPARENIVKSVMQSQYVMRRWPAELVGGARVITYFGGEPQSAGNWAYLLDDNTPRPVAATLAVLAGKLAQARPLGLAYVAPEAVLYLFEKDGKGLAVASTVADNGPEVTLRLDAGARSILMTDHQGNETALETEGGALSCSVGPMPVFLEGFDLARLAAYAGLSIGLQGDAPSPTVTVADGKGAAIPVRVRNPLAVKVAGRVSAALDSGAKTAPVPFALEAGAGTVVNLPLPDGAAIASAKGRVTLEWQSPIGASVAKPFSLVVIKRDQLGNLLANPEFEEAAQPKGVAGWNSNWAKCVSLVPEGGVPLPGFDGHAMRFDGNGNWQNAFQKVELPAPGQTYLYTAWVWNTDIEAGSNLHFTKKSGATSSAFIPDVFSAGKGSGFWRLLTHRRVTTDEVVSIGFQPVCKGAGHVLFDNLSVTIFEGSDYAAQARRAAKPVTVDGSLADWTRENPIPLLCENQLSATGGYAWKPESLSGVAWLRWDDAALYFAAWVRDDKHVAKTGDECADADSIVLALHPANRTEGTDARAFAWYLSEARPGGGSGLHTLYRPAKLSGGLSSGQLAKDSSVYEIAVKRAGECTVYEVRIPWSETGGVVPAVGTKLGLSLQLNDRDGDKGLGCMNWGGGLKPSWSPSGFGVLTLVE